jgi:hypothetical protein
MPNPLSPDEIADIEWVASGAAESDLGVRSWLGPMGDKLRSGTIRCSSAPAEGRDCGPAAERLLRVKRRLDEAESASPGAARVLLAHFGPRNDRGLVSFGQLGLVMLLCSDDESTALDKDATLARKGNAGAVARLEALRAKADGEFDRAAAAYAATRPARVDDEASRERQGKARAKREDERRDAFAGRTDEAGRVVFATPAVRRAAGGGR